MVRLIRLAINYYDSFQISHGLPEAPSSSLYTVCQLQQRKFTAEGTKKRVFPREQSGMLYGAAQGGRWQIEGGGTGRGCKEIERCSWEYLEPETTRPSLNFPIKPQ